MYLKGQEWQLRKRQQASEYVMAVVIKGMGMLVVLTVLAITFYLFYKGMPFWQEHGIGSMLLNSRWAPAEEQPSYGISYMIGASVYAGLGAVAVAMPIGVIIALYLVELAPRWFADILWQVMELMSGIPSILYGLCGMILLTPGLYKWEKVWCLEGEKIYIPSGGANLLAAILVLAVMILPSVVITAGTAMQEVSKRQRLEAKALGASRFQVAVGVVLQGAEGGITAAGILALGRAIGETMAVSFVAGGVVNRPRLFSAVRLLTTALVSEMGYAKGVHREALFCIGLILYLLIMILIGGLHGVAEKKWGKKNH